jgi:hypothetical protein
MFTFGPRAAAADQGRCASRFRGNVGRNCLWSLQCVGWPRLTCGPDLNGTHPRRSKPNVKTSLDLQASASPLTCANRGKRGKCHGADRALAFQDPHKKPTTVACGGRGSRRPGQGPNAPRATGCRHPRERGPPARHPRRRSCGDGGGGGCDGVPGAASGDRWRAVWYENGRRSAAVPGSDRGGPGQKITARLAGAFPHVNRQIHGLGR